MAARPARPAHYDHRLTNPHRPLHRRLQPPRTHRSLPHRATPAAAYSTRPKAQPSGTRDGDTHTRVRHDRVDHTGVVTLRISGRLHHIGIGRTHARTHVILLVDDLHVRVVNATTRQLLRELTIDPTRDYQPQYTKKPPNP
ncbi:MULTISPECIES: hypothetical protein [unclassified Microbispora]|uniref:hypothetical protein n=1 Tax=unclassified Microbispora TaxID=2614687 RepID=UPI00197B92D5|nr:MULTISPECIES: hypothetical protein [unclassified Microbispora]